MKNNKLSLYDICQDCGTQCCTEPGPPIVFLEEATKIREYVSGNSLKNYLQKAKGKDYFIIPRDERGCPYLNSGKCEIQDVKPLDCQIYPLNPLEKKGRIETGVSETCPAKHLLTSEYKKEVLNLFESLDEKEKREFAMLARNQGYVLRERPSDYGLELVLDLYGCNSDVLRSKQELIKYNKEIVKVIDMQEVGEPIIPEKFGKGNLFGYSSVQFIQTSSITTHISEKMLEAHVNIFSCKDFDTKKATNFTKDFFKARKIKSRKFKR